MVDGRDVSHGVILTSLGEAVARLYTSRPNLLGQEIFETWLNSLSENDADKQDLPNNCMEADGGGERWLAEINRQLASQLEPSP